MSTKAVPAKEEATASAQRDSLPNVDIPVSEASVVEVDATSEIPEDEIRERAYAHFLSRSSSDASADEDWFRAVDELRLERSGISKPKDE